MCVCVRERERQLFFRTLSFLTYCMIFQASLVSPELRKMKSKQDSGQSFDDIKQADGDWSLAISPSFDDIKQADGDWSQATTPSLDEVPALCG